MRDLLDHTDNNPRHRYKPGEKFNPYRMFVGSFVPNAIMQCREMSSTAKLTWARLAQYAGEDGKAYPKQQVLADELGLSRRQVNRVLNELVELKLIERKTPRYKARAKERQATEYYFLWHKLFERACVMSGTSSNEACDVGVTSPCDEYGTSPCDISGQKHVTYTAHQENHLREPEQENHNNDNRADTGQGGGCGGQSDFSLSQEQKEYIDLAVDKRHAEGRINTTKTRYRKSLEEKAQNGILDISDLNDLREWKNKPSSGNVRTDQNIRTAQEWLKDNNAGDDDEREVISEVVGSVEWHKKGFENLFNNPECSRTPYELIRSQLFSYMFDIKKPSKNYMTALRELWPNEYHDAEKDIELKNNIKVISMGTFAPVQRL